MAYVYIVECEDTSLYTGITKDICKRMKTHTSAKGAAARYTKSHKIKSLRALWYCDDYKAAAKLEYAIKKRLKRQEKLCLVENPSGLNELLPDFAEYEFKYVEGITLEMCLEKTQESFCMGDNMTNVIIRKFNESDTQEVLNIIHRNSIEINSKDYGIESMQKFVEICNADWLAKRASFSHFYVAVDNEKVVGVGGISSYFGSADESILLTIFVLPEYQNKGIGKSIVKALENDEYGLRAKRIEIPASITAVEFYLKLGYDYKNGIKELDEERHYRLEKKNEFNNKASLV